MGRRYAVDAELAEEVRAAFTDPRTGWPPSALIDLAGIAAVCELRAENGQPPLHAPATYVSLEPYRRVFGFGARPVTTRPATAGPDLDGSPYPRFTDDEYVRRRAAVDACGRPRISMQSSSTARGTPATSCST